MQIETEVSPLSHVKGFDRFPVLDRLFRLMDQQPSRVIVEPHENGTDVAFLNDINGKRNRGHLRILFPAENECAFFFYRKNLVPLSSDRSDCGGLVMDSRSEAWFDDTDVAEWVQFMMNGLQPEFKPKTVTTDMPYTIPQD